MQVESSRNSRAQCLVHRRHLINACFLNERREGEEWLNNGFQICDGIECRQRQTTVLGFQEGTHFKWQQEGFGKPCAEFRITIHRNRLPSGAASLPSVEVSV